MCGILGAVGAIANIGEQKFIDALDLIRHRGPDSGAVWHNPGVFLGHRRLAIIDLAKHADQPMPFSDFVIVFNGEIYNYRVLRQELETLGHHFITHSDTEVLLHAWQEWGADSLQRLEGMFAFALWNRRTRKLFLARDRFGEKPLFIYSSKDGLAFSSELQALIRLSEGRLTENSAAIGLLFQYSYIPAPYGAFKEIEQLEPGCWLEWSEAGIQRKRYYELHTSLQEAKHEETPNYFDAAKSLRQRLSTAVRLRMETADVPVATLLSGGIDSSIITVLAAQTSKQNLPIYSLGFPKDPSFDETDYAIEVVKTLPNARHHIVEANEQIILEFADQVLDHLGEPYADASILPTSFLCSHIQEKVALGGDAADELFAGYGVYPAIRQSASLPSFVRNILRFIPAHRNPASIAYAPLRAAALFHHHLRDNPLDEYLSWRTYASASSLAKLGLDVSAASDVKKYIGQKFSGSLSDIQAMDLTFNLPNDMLKKVDYAAMIHGVEVRLPFLDSELVHWTLNLPDTYRLAGKVRKRILRDAFADLLPEKIMRRGKMGFLLPIRKWFRNGQLRSELEALLNKQNAIEPKYAQEFIAAHAAGHVDHSVLLWTLYIYLRWRQRVSIWARHTASETQSIDVQRVPNMALAS